MKHCNKCGETKPETEFYAYCGKLQSYCKECALKRQREYRKRNNYYKIQKKEKIARPVSSATKEQRFAAAVIIARAKAALKVARGRGLMPRGVDLIGAAMDDVRKHGVELKIV